MPEILYLMHARGENWEEFGLYRDRDKAQGQADDRADPGVLTEVFGMVVLDRLDAECPLGQLL